MRAFLNKKNSGYSLVEMLIYVTILSLISIVLINMLLSFTKSYRIVSALRLAEHSGIDSMERLTRDIRSASSVDSVNSTFGSSPGVLTVTTPEGIRKFYVQNGILKLDVAGTYFGPLTLTNTTVTSLIFRLLDNGVSQAIKIDLTVQAVVGGVTKTKNYHSTVILRGH